MSTGLPAAPKGGMNLRNAGVEIRRHLHQRQAVVDAGVGKQNSRTAGAGDDNNIFTLGRRQHLQAAGELQQVI